jgi:hypothetical protein
LQSVARGQSGATETPPDVCIAHLHHLHVAVDILSILKGRDPHDIVSQYREPWALLLPQIAVIVPPAPRTMPVINERDFPLLPSQTAKRKKGGHAKKPRTPGTRSTLHDLPDELILEILHYLPGIDSDNFQLPTLLSLALTSRRLYRIAIEKIYIGYDSHFCEPYLFLRTLVSKPELAGLVQKLNLTQGPRSRRGTVSYVPTARDKKTLKEGMRTLAIPGWKDWVADCNGDRITDVTVHNAILLHAPNITSLRVEDVARVDTRCPAWVDVVSKSSAGTLSGHTHRFEHLRKISVDVRSANLNQLAPLFRLQTLHRLQLREISEPGMGNCINCDECHGEKIQTVPRLRRLIPEACNNLEELILEHTFYCIDILRVLLASPRQLKSFKYDVSLDHMSEEYIQEDLPFATIFGRQRTSLEYIHIFCDALAEGETAGDINLHSSLADFQSLKHISCPLSMIAPPNIEPLFERLPPSLLTFRMTIRPLTKDQDSLCELENMAAYCPTHKTQLKEVRVVAPKSAKWLKYDWERLVSPFSKAGIDFVVQNESDNEEDSSEGWDDASSASSHSSDEVNLYSDED